MKKTYLNWEIFLIVLISIGFTIWSGWFIRESSFITIDGRRSYSLFDDAMISMRYAWNFSHGNGLVWNQGEYIQGYTNLLMVLIMSPATLVLSKTNAVLAIQLLGVVFVLTVAYLNLKIANIVFLSENRNRHRFFRTLSFLCGLSYYPLVYWSLMGMETGLLAVLLLAGVFTSFEHVKSRNPKYLFLAAIFGGLAFLTRNDSLIFSSVLWIYIYVECFWVNGEDKPWKQYLASIGLYLLFVMVQLAFQYLYYGEFLPNTYFLKLTGMPLSLRIQNGLRFITPFLGELAFVFLLSSISLLLNFRKDKLILYILILSAMAYQIYVGGDPWNYWRIMAPTVPLAFILAIDATNSIANKIMAKSALPKYFNDGKAGSRFLVSGFLTTVLVFVGTLLADFRFLPEILFRSPPDTSISNRQNVNIAIALNEILTDKASIGVLWAGSIPYYTDKRAVDFLGKSDRYIAHLSPDISGSVSWMGISSVPGHNKYDLYYSIIELQPTYVQTFYWGKQDVSQLAEPMYIKVKYRGITLYIRKGSPDVLWTRLKHP